MDLEGKPFWEKLPILPEHLEGIYRSFWELSGDRPFGGMGGVGGIPFTSVDRYAARRGIEGEEFEEFWFLIHSMDQIYLKYFNRQRGGH